MPSVSSSVPIPRLAIVVPCFNEERVLPESSCRLSAVLDSLESDGRILPGSFVLFVNDGSQDSTWSVIERLHDTDPRLRGVNLAANVGQQNALWAGLSVANDLADAVVSIDADLQDDVTVIADMVDSFRRGSDVVYGVRNDRSSDSLFKRSTAQGFYWLMNRLGAKTVYNHADFRLLSRRAVAFLLSFPERNLFIRGLVPLIGYKSDVVRYERAPRVAGESHYPLAKMLSFAIDGITSFSVRPIRLVLSLGVFFVFVALAVLAWTLYSHFSGQTVPGWSSIMLSIWFCSGCVLIGLGVVGEYVGKIYVEVKQRPRFNILQIL